MTDFETKDSGKRETFTTGMQRDTHSDKPRFDLVRPLALPYQEQMLTRWANLMMRGAQKYEARNWEKARTREELERFYASAARHFEQWIAGEIDEDHAAAVFFNVAGAEYVRWWMNKDKPKCFLPEEEAQTFTEEEIIDDASTGAVDYLRKHPLFPLKPDLNFFLDMDGVICDFLSGALEQLNKEYNKTVTIKEYADNFGKWETYAYYGISEIDFWRVINKPKFWLNLKPLPWAQALYYKLSSIGKVTIITTPAPYDGDCAQQKIEWLENNFNIDPTDIFIGGRKYLMAGNGILIDDNRRNVDRFIAAGGEAILVPSNWNNSTCNYDTVWAMIQNYLDLRKVRNKHVAAE